MRARRTLLVSVLLLTICVTLGCERNQLNRGLQFELQGNYATALQSYRQALEHVPAKSKTRAEILDRIGECLVRLNRPQDAYTSFQQAVEVDPNDVTARLRIGQMLLEAGAPSRAREQANLILRTTPTNIEALELLGAAWSTSGKFDLAKAAYTRVLERDPTRVKVAIALADIYNREDNAPRAEQILKDAANSHPGDAMPWLALARLHEEQGDGHQAEAAYRKAVVVHDTPETNMRLAQFLQRSSRILEAEQVLRRVDAEQPAEPVALADFQLLSGRPGKAVQTYANALAVPGHWSLPLADKFRSDSNHNQGDVAARMVEAELAKASRLQGDQRKQAMASVRTLVSENRRRFDDATAEMLECELTLAEGNLASSKLLSANALKLAPTSAAAHYVAGLVASADGDDDTARTEWQEALNHDPHFGPARLAVAQDVLAHHDPETADENARLVVRQDPGDLQATLVFSRALFMEGKPLAAAVMAQRANALDPSSPEPSLILGEVAVEVHNRSQALIHFERALSLRPDCEEAMAGLLKLYDMRHLSHADIQKIEHVAEEPPVSSTLLEIAGRLYAQGGWRDDAIRVLQHTVEMDPKRITAARFLARLQLASGNFAGAAQSAMKAGIDAQALLTAYSDQSSGNWQKAIDTYEQAVRDGDQTGVAANNAAWLYAEHGVHLDRALSLAQTAAHQSPNDPAILDTLALVHLRRREYTDAVRLLETAAHLSAMLPHDSANRDLGEQIRKHLSEAYLRAGQTKEAMRIAQQRNPFSMR